MGLRYRKSVTLCKGVRLNFGKNGMSVTTGTRGFHNTYNFGTGERTTSICLQLFNSCGKRHFCAASGFTCNRSCVI